MTQGRLSQPASGDRRSPAAPSATAITPEMAQTGTALMFKTILAGRAWLRAQQGAAANPRVPACASMKPGSDEPPLFMIPGAPGSVLQLGPIAAALPIPMPVYAIKPRGLEEGEIPCRTIAEMAEYSIGAIRTLRPNGPYLLLGYSAGGLLALEIARQLTAAGQAVPLVVLLDTQPGKQYWPLRCHLDILTRRSCDAVRSLVRQAPSQLVRELGRRLRSLSSYLAESGVKALPANAVVAEGANEAARRVYLATYDAGEAYRPSPYPGKVVFVQPYEVSNLEPRSPKQVWGPWLPEMEIRRVPGTHLGMVETGAAEIAAQVGECVMKALGASASGTGVVTQAGRGSRPGWKPLQPSMESE